MTQCCLYGFPQFFFFSLGISVVHLDPWGNALEFEIVPSFPVTSTTAWWEITMGLELMVRCEPAFLVLFVLSPGKS